MVKRKLWTVTHSEINQTVRPQGRIKAEGIVSYMIFCIFVIVNKTHETYNELIHKQDLSIYQSLICLIPLSRRCSIISGRY